MRRSHDETLRQAGGGTMRSMVARIVRVWSKATDSDKEHGASWYAEGETFVRSLAYSTGRHPHVVAAVVAHLSPQTRWSRNVYGATMLLTEGHAPTCMPANVERARDAMEAYDPLSTLHGPKTSRFAANLLGDRESVTVDMWTARVALGRDEYEPILRRAGVYAAIEHAYQLAALRVGVEPATMQATCWIVARNGRWQ